MLFLKLGTWILFDDPGYPGSTKLISQSWSYACKLARQGSTWRHRLAPRGIKPRIERILNPSLPLGRTISLLQYRHPQLKMFKHCISTDNPTTQQTESLQEPKCLNRQTSACALLIQVKESKSTPLYEWTAKSLNIVRKILGRMYKNLPKKLKQKQSEENTCKTLTIRGGRPSFIKQTLENIWNALLLLIN